MPRANAAGQSVAGGTQSRLKAMRPFPSLRSGRDTTAWSCHRRAASWRVRTTLRVIGVGHNALLEIRGHGIVVGHRCSRDGWPGGATKRCARSGSALDGISALGTMAKAPASMSNGASTLCICYRREVVCLMAGRPARLVHGRSSPRSDQGRKMRCRSGNSQMKRDSIDRGIALPLVLCSRPGVLLPRVRVRTRDRGFQLCRRRRIPSSLGSAPDGFSMGKCGNTPRSPTTERIHRQQQNRHRSGTVAPDDRASGGWVRGDLGVGVTWVPTRSLSNTAIMFRTQARPRCIVNEALVTRLSGASSRSRRRFRQGGSTRSP